MIMGHEGSGKVVKVGSGVKHLKIGTAMHVMKWLVYGCTLNAWKNSKLKTKTAIDYIEKFNQSCEGIKMNGIVILITF